MRMVVYGAVITLAAFGISLAALNLSGPGDAAEVQADPMGMDHSAMAMGEDMANATAEMDHDHPLLDIAEGAPVPTVTHLAFPDAMDGFNIQILTENFAFTPAAINGEVEQNEGHAHLYVNGEKIQRVYGNWVHLPASLLESGANAVTITLNANDHSEWAVDGAVVASTVIVYRP